MLRDLSFIPPHVTVADAWQRATNREAAAHLVGSRERLLGVVTPQQLDEWRRAGKSDNRVDALVDGSFVHAHGDHPVDVLIDRLAQSQGVLPIVSRRDVHEVEGIVTPDCILPTGRRPSTQPAAAPAPLDRPADR